jgi:hypothetical protein
MSFDEFKLLLIFLVVVYVCIRFLGRNPILTLRAFSYFCVMGFIAQLALGREINRYTPNITIYISYVSLAVIIAWGTGFSLLWAFHSWLAERFKICSGLGTYCICGIPMLIGLEVIGSNVIKMKLYNYHQYSALIPSLRTMNAPIWLYVYYIGASIVMFYIAKALGLYVADWKGSMVGNFPAISGSERVD